MSAVRAFRVVRGDSPEDGNYAIEYGLDAALETAHVLAAEHEDWFEVIDENCKVLAVVEWFPAEVPA